MKIDYYDTDISAVLSGLASLFLGYAGAIVLLVLIAGGIYYATAQGDPDRQKRAKNTISFAILGLIIIVVSYAIVKTIDRVVTGQ
jgi:hypothetical protein